MIGDKKGGRSTARLGEDIGLLDRLRATVGVDVYVVQVVRNPYDVIATMQRRAPKRQLPDVVDLFFDLADTVEDVRRRVGPDRFHELYHDELITDPTATLRELCRFLSLPASADYLAACSAIIFDAPHRTRSDVGWTPELIERVGARSAEHPSLAHYRFDDRAPSAESA